MWAIRSSVPPEQFQPLKLKNQILHEKHISTGFTIPTCANLATSPTSISSITIIYNSKQSSREGLTALKEEGFSHLLSTSDIDTSPRSALTYDRLGSYAATLLPFELGESAIHFAESCGTQQPAPRQPPPAPNRQSKYRDRTNRASRPGYER